ncbi:unnamed protein product [Heterobilharzia americana]|nr:unnamed protein product [Heterobilharzia americana]
MRISSTAHETILLFFYIGILFNKFSPQQAVHNSGIFNLHNIYTKDKLTHHQQQLLKTLHHIPGISFDVNGEFPIIDNPDLFQHEQDFESWRRQKSIHSLLRPKRDVLQDLDEIPLNDPLNSLFFNLQQLILSIQNMNIHELNQPKCIFLQFSKGSIISNAILSFNTKINSLFTPDILSNILIEGSKQLINAIAKDTKFHLGFSFHGNFSLKLTKIEEESTVSSTFEQPVTMTTRIANDAEEIRTYSGRASAEILRSEEDSQNSTINNVVTYPVRTKDTQVLGFQLAKEGEPLQWDDSLDDVNSELYQNMSRNVCNLVQSSLNVSSLEGWRIECLSVDFIQGSVLANVTLLFENDNNSTYTYGQFQR